MGLTYMVITGYKDANFGGSTGTYRVLMNPEKMSENLTIEYTKKQAQGKANTSIKYSKSPPSKMNFELIFDCTGVVNPKRVDLNKELEDFKKVVYDYNGSIHEPNYLKVKWGGAFDYPCRLESLSIEYTLFKPTGDPLRAKVQMSVTNFESPEAISREESKSSPDMTHTVQVSAGDTLPGLCEQIYGDTKCYPQVARFNSLYNYRYLQPGITLQFPPLVTPTDG